MRRISKRLEALERAAEDQIFADAVPFAVAYHLGGARNLSEVAHGYARALGYKDLDEFCRASAYLLSQPSASVDERAAHEERIHRARNSLLAKFGYTRLRPAALTHAFSRIMRTLPEDWLAAIKSLHRKDCEDEARANQFLKNLMERAEECQRSPYQTAPSRPKAVKGKQHSR